MPRNRIIYQSQAVALSGACITGTAALPTNVAIIPGVQSITYGIEVGREDVNHFGTLGAVDRVILEAPTATQEVQFHFPNGVITAAILNKLVTDALGDGNNCLVVSLDSDEGNDYSTTLLGGPTGGVTSLGMQAGKLSSLSVETSVGAIPTMTLGFEGSALLYGIPNPVGSPVDYSAHLKSFTNVSLSLVHGSSIHFAHAQSASISFDLGSEGLQRLGAGGLVYARVPTFPATATLEVEGLAVDKGMSIDLNNMASRAGQATQEFPAPNPDGSANTASPSLDMGGRADISLTVGSIKFTLVKATLDSVSFNGAVGDNATCSATFGVSIGGASSVSTLVISAVS